MSLANSSLKKRSKPDKPSPDFPLTASGNGQWIRRINGKIYCFGVWEDPAGALVRQAKPLHRFSKVLWYAFAVTVDHS